MQIVFDSSITKNYELAKDREWIMANGLGSYASSTVIGLNTRGYHGLLVASLVPPVKRTLLLSKFEEEIQVNEKKYLLAVNKYPGTVYPQGHLHIEQFRFDRFPVFVYRLGNTILEKSVFMPHGDNSCITTYKVIESDGPVRISISPIINHRDFNGRTKEDSRWNFTQSRNPKGVEIRAFSGATTLYLQSDIASYHTTGQWYKNFIYENSPRVDDKEDQYNPGYFATKLDQGYQVSVLASLREQATFSTEGQRYREMQRMRKITGNLPLSDSFFSTLVELSDSFIVSRMNPGTRSIVAGYHRLEDRGGDAMIYIPGLTLVTKREEEAKAIIRTFLDQVRDGLVPNVLSEKFEDGNYESIDVSLWLINASYVLYSETGSLEFVREIYPKLESIINSYIHGTRYGIVVDSDGLVKGGSEKLALTWMDAKLNDVPVTPRFGKPVEVSALWYNSLRAMERFATDLKRNSSEYRLLAEKTKISFEQKFWNAEKQCLHDVLVDGKGDGKIRPNQILSLSLPFPVLDMTMGRGVLRAVDSELLTPVGLRSLSPQEREYKGECVGKNEERSLAYHQGSAWPWLFGSYVTAYLRVFPGDSKSLEYVRQLYSPFIKRMYEAGVGTISELYDGDEPNKARGCISQASSIAEILRSYARDANQF
ncbi:MAG: amylo-alpha-1,6-glucosidase [Nitrososphaerales archaeon]